MNDPGGVFEARAYIHGNKVIVRADHPEFSLMQLLKHEVGHHKIRTGKVDMKKVYDAIVDFATEGYVQYVIESYVNAYATLEGYDAEYILEEILCDYEAGMNIFSEEDVSSLFWEIAQEVLQSDAVKADPARGPPTEGVFSRAQRGRSIELETMENNRFQRLRQFHGDVPAQWYAYTRDFFYIYSNQSFTDYTILAKVSITSKNSEAIGSFTEELEHGTYEYSETFDQWSAAFRRGKGRYRWDSIRNGNRGAAVPADGVDGRKQRGQNARNSKEGSRIGTAEVTGPKEKFSREATDKLYLSAVESGDMETVQRMVDEAAKQAGYTIKAYHGTSADFFTFDKGRIGKGTDQYGAGFYFASGKEAARHYGSRVINSVLKIDNPFVISSVNLLDAEIALTGEQAYAVVKRHPLMYDPEESPLGDYYDSYWESGVKEWMVEDLATRYTDLGYLDSDLFRYYPNELHEALRDITGHDGIAVNLSNGEKFYVAWFDTQMKLADPVTYDGKGNVIPLSQRFNEAKADIRYSRETSYAEQVDKVKNNTHDPNNHVYMGTTPMGIAKIFDLPKLPMLVTSQHIYSMAVSEQQAKADGRYRKRMNYHDLGWEVVKKMPEYINNPVLIIKSNTASDDATFVVVTAETDKAGNSLIAAVKPNGKGKYFNIEFPTNIMLRSYGKDGIQSYVATAKTENRILYASKKNSQKNKANPSVQFADVLLSSDYSTNIAEFKKIVNKKFEGTIFANSGLPKYIDRRFSREFIQAQMTEKEMLLEKTNRMLERENGKLREDNQYLKELVKIQKSLTGGMLIHKAQKRFTACVC